jgi:hypothetical protein
MQNAPPLIQKANTLMWDFFVYGCKWCYSYGIVQLGLQTALDHL